MYVCYRALVRTCKVDPRAITLVAGNNNDLTSPSLVRDYIPIAIYLPLGGIETFAGYTWANSICSSNMHVQ